MDSLINLLEDIDSIQEDYYGLKNEIHILKGNLAFEENKALAFEKCNSDLILEIDNLKKFHEEELKLINKQYDFYAKYKNACETIEKLEDSNKTKLQDEIERRMQAESFSNFEKKQLLEKIGKLEKCVVEGEEKKKSLEFQVADLSSQILELTKKNEEDIMSAEVKFFDELNDVQAKYAEKCEEVNKLEKALTEADKETMASKMKMEEFHRQEGKNWQMEIFKQKAMQLRKENEELKQKLQLLMPQNASRF